MYCCGYFLVFSFDLTYFQWNHIWTMQRMLAQQRLRLVIQLITHKPEYVLTLVYYRCLELCATSSNYFPFVWYSWHDYSAMLHSVVVVSWNVDCTGQEALLYGWSVADPVCRHQPFDSVAVFSAPLCLQCLFDVTLAERERHHWVVGVLFCCVPFMPAVECTESNTTRVGHCLPVELITLMAPP